MNKWLLLGALALWSVRAALWAVGFELPGRRLIKDAGPNPEVACAEPRSQVDHEEPLPEER